MVGFAACHLWRRWILQAEDVGVHPETSVEAADAEEAAPVVERLHAVIARHRFVLATFAACGARIDDQG